MFPAKILLANILVPIIVATGSSLIAKFRARRSLGQVEDDELAAPRTGRSQFEGLLGAVAAALAIWLAFGLRNGFSIYPVDDAWMRIPFATLLVAVGGILTLPLGGLGRWTVRLGFLAVASWTVFPTGENWGFLWDSRYYWVTALAISSWIGWFGIEIRAPRDSGILALAWIPCFASAAFLTAQSFMKVTEPMLAISSVIGCFAIAALALRRGELLHGAAGPCLLASAAAIANAQFNSYLGLSDFLSGLAILSPAIVTCSSIPFLARRKGQESVVTARKRGMPVTVAVSLMVSAAVVVWTQVASGGAEEEW